MEADHIIRQVVNQLLCETHIQATRGDFTEVKPQVLDMMVLSKFGVTVSYRDRGIFAVCSAIHIVPKGGLELWTWRRRGCETVLIMN